MFGLYSFNALMSTIVTFNLNVALHLGKKALKLDDTLFRKNKIF